MVDTSKFTLDTPVYIKIPMPGYYIHELSAHTPLMSYASIEEVIAIMNRGIKVEFPKQEKNEISLKIEDILLDYEERKQKLSRKYGEIGTNIDKAIDVITAINDSKITEEEQKEEEESHIFEYTDVKKRVASNLSDTSYKHIFESDDYTSSEDRIDAAEKMRKSRERINKAKREALEISKLEAETLRKLSQDAKFEDKLNEKFMELDYLDTSTDVKSVKNNPFK